MPATTSPRSQFRSYRLSQLRTGIGRFTSFAPSLTPEPMHTVALNRMLHPQRSVVIAQTIFGFGRGQILSLLTVFSHARLLACSPGKNVGYRFSADFGFDE